MSEDSPKSAAAGSSMAQARTNRLAHETSPYLLQHARNPVDWYPWGEAALERARAEDRPIFLSVGYSTCYWCHVMERQVFEDEALASQMNEHFVNVKVDREERPDVDEVYMSAVQMMTGRGGWPMSVFLTPPGAGEDGRAGLRPFWAGTYIPPQPMHSMPGFGQVLHGLSKAWREDRARVLEQAERIGEAVTHHFQLQETAGSLHTKLIEQAASQVLASYDCSNGGFGGAPKFPLPCQMSFLLDVARHSQNEQVGRAVHHTLRAMAHGGIYDQIGGGFHRYSVDAQWLVPHFEKMLYDNGQLVELYGRAYAGAPTSENASIYEHVIRQTCEYIRREMTDEQTGAFYSAQDAEVDAREGGSYIWRREEVERALAEAPDDLAAIAVKLYGLDRGTNFEDPHDPSAEPANVLYLPRSLNALADELGMDQPSLAARRETINARLLAARQTRPQPATDQKVLAGWNGMMIAGLACAGHVLSDRTYLKMARRAAEGVLENMCDSEGNLYRTMRDGVVRIDGFLEDYAFMVHGLLCLHRAGEGEHLESTRRLVDVVMHRFALDQGGYEDVQAGASDLFVRPRTQHDGVIPAASSRMIHNLIDLHELTGETVWLERAETDLHQFGQLLERTGAGLTHMQHALLRMLAIAPQRIEREPEQCEAGAIQSHLVRTTVHPSPIDMREGASDIEVRLTIEPGYHISAHEPGDPNLAPTTLTIRPGCGLHLEVDYPPGESYHPAFADQSIRVYRDRVMLTGRLEPTGEAPATEPALVLRYQACTEQMCHESQVCEIPLEITEDT